eukprot:3183455-Pyramimonas_sp.AAC.1
MNSGPLDAHVELWESRQSPSFRRVSTKRGPSVKSVLEGQRLRPRIQAWRGGEGRGAGSRMADAKPSASARGPDEAEARRGPRAPASRGGGSAASGAARGGSSAEAA